MFRALGVITGTMSLVTLLWEGFSVGFGPVASLVLDYYQRLVALLLGWSEPYLRELSVNLGRYVGIEIDLYPHWKHVFVLLMLYVGACVKSTWTEYDGGKAVSIFVCIWGVVVALVASVAAGTASLEERSASVLIAAYPISAVVVFELGLTAIDAKYFRNEGIRFAAIGAVLLLAGSIVNGTTLLNGIPNVGLVVLITFVVILGLYWTLYGATDPQGVGDTRWKKFTSAAPTRLGLILLSSITGALLFLLLNAGLGLLGL